MRKTWVLGLVAAAVVGVSLFVSLRKGAPPGPPPLDRAPGPQDLDGPAAYKSFLERFRVTPDAKVVLKYTSRSSSDLRFSRYIDLIQVDASGTTTIERSSTTYQGRIVDEPAPVVRRQSGIRVGPQGFQSWIDVVMASGLDGLRPSDARYQTDPLFGRSPRTRTNASSCT